MKKGTLTFGIPMNLGTYLLPMFLPEFSECYPGIQIQIRENNTSELERLLIARKIDFCIMHDYGKQEMIEYESFSDDPFYLVIPAAKKEEYCLPEEKALTAGELKKLAEAPFIMVANRQKLRLVVDDILSAAGIKPKIRCTTKSMETAKRLVAGGMGVTFLPRSYLTLYSGTEGLASYPLEECLNGSWKLVAAYLKKGAFIKMLQRVSADAQRRHAKSEIKPGEISLRLYGFSKQFQKQFYLRQPVIGLPIQNICISYKGCSVVKISFSV